MILTLIRMISHTINPFRSFKHINFYYNCIMQHGKCERWTHQTINLIFYIIIFHHIQLYFIQWSHNYRILLYDIFYIMKLDPILNVLYALLIFVILCFEHAHYFRLNSGRVLKIIINSLDKSDKSYFDLKTNKFFNISIKYRPGRSPANLRKLTIRFEKYIYYLGQLFLLFLTFVNIFWHIQLINSIRENESFYLNNSLIINVIKILISELMLILLLTSFYSFLNYVRHAGIIVISCCAAGLFKFRQLDEFLVDYFHQLTPYKLRIFFISHTETIRLMFEMNRIYSLPCTVYIFANIPFNVFLIMTTLFAASGKDNIELIMISLMIIQQFIGLFGVHLLIASFSKHIHKKNLPL